MPATQRSSRFSSSATKPYARPVNQSPCRGEHFTRSSPKRQARIVLWHRFITRTLGIKPSLELPTTVKKEQITPERLGSHKGTPNLGVRQSSEQLEIELNQRDLKLEPASPKSPTPAPISQDRWSPTLIRSPSELISTTPSESHVPPLRHSDTSAPSSPATDVLTPPQSDIITPLPLESPEAAHQFPRRFNPRALLPAIDAFDLTGADPYLRYTFDRPAVARTFRRLRDAYGSVADSLDPPPVDDNLRSRTPSVTISIRENDMPVSRDRLLDPLYSFNSGESQMEGGNGDVFDIPANLPSSLDAPLAIPDTYHLSPTRNCPPPSLNGGLPLAFSTFNPNVRSAFEETRPPSPFYSSAPAPEFQFTPPLGPSSKRLGRLEELAAAVCRSSLSLLHQTQMEQAAGSAVERSAVPSSRPPSSATRQASAGPETAFPPRSKQPASDSVNTGS